MSKPVLFYSKNSENCIQLWKLLKSKNKLNEFIKICVDNNPKVPRFVTEVPCIFVKNRPLIVGNAIQMYLNTINQSGIKTEKPNFQQTTSNNKLDKPPDIESSTNNLGGILDFNAIEMGGAYSDKYSFIQENPSPMDNQYQFLNKLADNSITGNNTTNNIDNNSKQGQLNNRLEQLQRERNNM